MIALGYIYNVPLNKEKMICRSYAYSNPLNQ